MKLDPGCRAALCFFKRDIVLVGSVREAIDRLRELRSALIAAAVTGIIDVREAAA